MRIHGITLVATLSACTFAVQPVATAPAMGTTSQAFSSLETDLRSLGADETLVLVRGDRPTGATSSVTLTGIASGSASADAVAAGLHTSWSPLDATTAAFAVRYDGPSRDTIAVSLIELHVPMEVALGMDAGAASFDVSGVSGPVRIATESGSISVVGASSVDLTSPVGAIDVTATSATIHGGAGGVRLDVGTIVGHAIDGAIVGTVRAGGAIRTEGGEVQLAIASTLASELTIDTHGGAVRLVLDRSAELVLDLDSSAGRVSITTPAVTHEGSPFVGAIGAGGPRVRVRTTGGAITVVSP